MSITIEASSIVSHFGIDEEAFVGTENSFDSKKQIRELKNRKHLRNVSEDNIPALLAAEKLASRFNFNETEETRRAIYVGAPAASMEDHDPYMDAQQKATDGFEEFGRLVMNAQPNTLLKALPNNALCYGSIIFNAKGPNSNYSSLEMSSFLSLAAAIRNLKYDKADVAICGGLNSSASKFLNQVYKEHNFIGGDFFTGSCFLSLKPDRSGSIEILQVKTGFGLENIPPLLEDLEFDIAFGAQGSFAKSRQLNLEDNLGYFCETSGLVELCYLDQNQAKFRGKKIIILKTSPFGDYGFIHCRVGENHA